MLAKPRTCLRQRRSDGAPTVCISTKVSRHRGQKTFSLPQAPFTTANRHNTHNIKGKPKETQPETQRGCPLTSRQHILYTDKPTRAFRRHTGDLRERQVHICHPVAASPPKSRCSPGAPASRSSLFAAVLSHGPLHGHERRMLHCQDPCSCYP